MSERVVVDGHGCHTAPHFGVIIKENQDKVPTLWWLPKLHKNPIKQDLLLILILVRQKNLLNCEPHVLQLLFWSINNSGEVLNKLKARYFNATSLSTYDFSTLYTTLLYNLIKDELIDVIERTFNREGSSYLSCNDINAFLARKT